jgi:hypothetical protein
MAKSSLDISHLIRKLIVKTLPGVNLTPFTKDFETDKNYENAITTRAGHIIEYNDTPGSERILLRHASGRGIDIQPDGKIIISSTARADVIEGDYNLVVHNDGSLSFGDLKINVTGDLDLNIGGAFNLQAESKTESITNNSLEFVQGNKTTTVSGVNATTIIGGDNTTILGNQNHSIKGEHTMTVTGSQKFISTGTLTMTNSGQIVMSAPNMNMAATSLTLAGATGTIGGEGIYVYGKNYFGTSASFSAGVSAPTFHGDLDGTSSGAIEATTAGIVGAVSSMSLTNSSTNSGSSQEPTAANISAWLGT